MLGGFLRGRGERTVAIAAATSVKCRVAATWRRLQALHDDLELLIFRPATPPTRLDHLKPPDLGTALITVHKDSSQYRALLSKAASAGRILLCTGNYYRSRYAEELFNHLAKAGGLAMIDDHVSEFDCNAPNSRRSRMVKKHYRLAACSRFRKISRANRAGGAREW